MKLREGLFKCPWCSLEFEKQIKKNRGKGKKGSGSDQCVCPGCHRNVSQKTKIELNKR